MHAHNLDVIACLLVSLAVVVPLAVFLDRRVNRNLDSHVDTALARIPDRSNVTRLDRKHGATVTRIDSKRTGGAAS